MGSCGSPGSTPCCSTSCCLTGLSQTFPLGPSARSTQSVIDAWRRCAPAFDAYPRWHRCGAGTVNLRDLGEGGTTPVNQFHLHPRCRQRPDAWRAVHASSKRPPAAFGIDGADTRTALANEAVENHPAARSQTTRCWTWRCRADAAGAAASPMWFAWLTNDASAANRSMTVVAGAGDDTVTVDVAEGDTILVEADDRRTYG
jgi:hypothetical protein